MGTRAIGLVGFGSIAEHSHLPAWQSLPDVEIAAVADVSGRRLDRARSLLPGAALYDSPTELIARGDVEIVDICAPPATHADLLAAACARGYPNIVCEKPLVLTEREYTRVAGAHRQSGSRIVSVNNWVHSDLNKHVLGALRAGAIGGVRRVELRIGRPDCALGDEGWNPRWRTDVNHAGGGIILDHGWHQIYLLMGWMGAAPQSVSATTRTANPAHAPVEDEALIELHFASGRATIELAWTAEGRTNGGIIRGDRGVIHAFDDRVVIDDGRSRRHVPFAGRLSASSYHPEWFRAVFQYNVLSETRDTADRNFAEAGTVVSVIQAAYRSARQNGEPCRLVPAWNDQRLSEETAVTNGYSSGGLSAQ